MEQGLFEYLNAAGESPLVAAVGCFFDAPWSALLLGVVFLLWCYQYGRWWWALAALLAVALTDPLVSQALKPWMARPRPCAELAWVAHPCGCGSGYSLPSAHAANTFALAGAVPRPWLWGLAAVVALSRVVIGVHYPTDVVAGAGVGILVGMLARALVEAVHRRWRARRAS